MPEKTTQEPVSAAPKPKRSRKKPQPRQITIPMPDWGRLKSRLFAVWVIWITLAVLFPGGWHTAIGVLPNTPQNTVQKSVKANLTNADRSAMKSAIGGVLGGSQTTPAEVREDLRYKLQGQELSPGFEKFNRDWQSVITADPPDETVEDVKKKLMLLRDNL